MRSPRRDHYLNPYTNDDTATALDRATNEVSHARGFGPTGGDISTTLHSLASLAKQIDDHINDAVTEARNHDYSWAQIGDLLGTTRASAWQRFNKPAQDTHNPSPSGARSTEHGGANSG